VIKFFRFLKIACFLIGFAFLCAAAAENGMQIQKEINADVSAWVFGKTSHEQDSSETTRALGCAFQFGALGVLALGFEILFLRSNRKRREEDRQWLRKNEIYQQTRGRAPGRF
jgi:hypothetical protein